MWLLTSEVHPGLETLPYATCWTVFPSDLVNDTVISPGTQVVVLTYRMTRHNVSSMVNHMRGLTKNSSDIFKVMCVVIKEEDGRGWSRTLTYAMRIMALNMLHEGIYSSFDYTTWKGSRYSIPLLNLSCNVGQHRNPWNVWQYQRSTFHDYHCENYWNCDYSPLTFYNAWLMVYYTVYGMRVLEFAGTRTLAAARLFLTVMLTWWESLLPPA